MTLDEALKLEAGPELDALVAREGLKGSARYER